MGLSVQPKARLLVSCRIWGAQWPWPVMVYTDSLSALQDLRGFCNIGLYFQWLQLFFKDFCWRSQLCFLCGHLTGEEQLFSSGKALLRVCYGQTRRKPRAPQVRSLEGVGVPWSLDPHQCCSESRCKAFMAHRRDALRDVPCNKSWGEQRCFLCSSKSVCFTQRPP